jgi:hypothetical protein
MNKTLEKCACGKELGEYDPWYVIDIMTQEFVCHECWVENKKKKKLEFKKCCRCHKVLDGVNFINHRFCNTYDENGKYKFNMVCIECEPYTPMGDWH